MKKIGIVLLLLMMPMVVLAKENIVVPMDDIEIIKGESVSINIGLDNAAGRIDFSSSNAGVASIDKDNLFLDMASDTLTINGDDIGSSVITIYAYDVSTYDSVDLSGREYQIKVTVKYRVGDINHNNKIELSDINQLLNWYISFDDISEEDKKIGDINGNNKIDLDDIILLLKIYLNT